MIDSFEVNGKKVVFRYPKLSDVKGIWNFYNKVIKESVEAGGNLSRFSEVSLEEEKKWIKNVMEKLKEENSIYLLAESNGKIIGSSDINLATEEAHKHVGYFGIAILEEFTGKGVGRRLMEKTIELARIKLKIGIVRLNVYSNNKRAQRLYKKMGFEKLGVIKNGSKIKGKYNDDIVMVKYL